MVVRVVAYDVLTLLLFTGTVIQIARVFPQAGTYQVAVASIAPIIACLARLYAGVGQIHRNACRRKIRRRQLAALVLGLVVLAGINSVVAYRAFYQKVGVDPTAIAAIATAIYLPLAIFAMYPGRTQSEKFMWSR